MYQKMDLQQFKNLSLEEMNTYKAKVTTRKNELEDLKTKGGKAWTDQLQEELNEVALFLVDLDEVIEEKEANGPKSPSYTPEKGTEQMVHLQIVHGRRFNSFTGKEESIPYVQMFTFAEWQLFKKNFARLGYTIMAALHDPYGDAAALVTKIK